MEHLPTSKEVDTEWHSYAQEQRGRIVSELAGLSPNQRAIVNEIAHDSVTQPTGKIFLQKVGLSSASTLQALKQLQEKDIIYRDETGTLRLLDPVIHYLISQVN